MLGHAPYGKLNALNTKDLGVMIMKQMHAPDDVEEVYIRHLALFVSIMTNFELYPIYVIIYNLVCVISEKVCEKHK